MTKHKLKNGGRERRPERASAQADPNSHYDIKESARYTDTMESLQIQKKLTSYAMHLLGHLPSKLPIICDLGCGSGLSSSHVSPTAYDALFIGLDISLPMLSLAQSKSKSNHALLACCDFGQGIPLRTSYCNAAISVSAVQWLCDRHHQQDNDKTATIPNSKIRTFMHSLHSILLPSTKAILQVYVEDDNQAAQLINGALFAGFRAGFYVGFPHPNPAKKYFICLEKTSCSNSGSLSSIYSKVCDQVLSSREEEEEEEKKMINRLTHNRSCPLAWPKTAPCALSWLHHIHHYTNNDNVCTRLIREHSSLGRKYLKLYRRILGERKEEEEGGGVQDEERNEEHPISTTTADSMFVYVEALATHRGLFPCGGAIVVHISGHIPIKHNDEEDDDGLVAIRRGVLSWGKRHIEDAVIKGGEVIKEEEMKVTAPCTDDVLKKMMMMMTERRRRGGGVLNDHKNTAPPLNNNNNNNNIDTFYSLEETGNRKVSILHAHKSTDIMVINFESSSEEEEGVVLSRLVAEYGGCVVGVQAYVYNNNNNNNGGGVEKTWFVYVPLSVDVSNMIAML